MRVKIIQDSKASTQNAPLYPNNWFIQYETTKNSFFNDKLTGWLSSADSTSQVNLKFSSLESAMDYAKAHKLEYEIIESKPKKLVKRAYADNFK